MGERELAQFAGEGPGLAGIFHAGLNDEGRALGSGRAEADEGAAGGAGGWARKTCSQGSVNSGPAAVVTRSTARPQNQSRPAASR
jgi:hypothetical protein